MRFVHEVPERHRRVIRALQAGPQAPERLHSRIEAMEAERARRSSALRLRPAAAAAAAAALLAVALVVVLSLGGPAGPSVVEAAQLSERASTQPSPPVSTEEPALLRHSFAGVTFPTWSREFRWHPAGARSDELAGRETETLFYTHTHHRIGYTVISGDPVKPPDDAETLKVRGLVLHRFRRGHLDVVTFERNGRTCVLAGDVHDPDTLVKLASWRGDGAVSF
jgi:hypothetical protein